MTITHRSQQPVRVAGCVVLILGLLAAFGAPAAQFTLNLVDGDGNPVRYPVLAPAHRNRRPLGAGFKVARRAAAATRRRTRDIRGHGYAGPDALFCQQNRG